MFNKNHLASETALNPIISSSGAPEEVTDIDMTRVLEVVNHLSANAQLKTAVVEDDTTSPIITLADVQANPDKRAFVLTTDALNSGTVIFRVTDAMYDGAYLPDLQKNFMHLIDNVLLEAGKTAEFRQLAQTNPHEFVMRSAEFITTVLTHQLADVPDYQRAGIAYIFGMLREANLLEDDKNVITFITKTDGTVPSVIYA